MDDAGVTRRVKLHEPTFGDEEIVAAVAVMKSTMVTMGEVVRAFESEFSANPAVMCNSGSSANLLAIAALCNPASKSRLKPGDEVIVSALSWSTTIWPLVQYGLIPVIVDIDPDTLNIDPNCVEAALSPKTRAIMPVHVYGNPCDMSGLTQIANRVGLYLIEDCCEALGATYAGDPVGTFGQLATFSFYFSHHISTMEGGMVTTYSPSLADRVRSLRSHGWDRGIANPPEQETEYLDPRFTFIHAGYNLRPTEVQAAMGRVQLPKLGRFVAARYLAANMLKERLLPYQDTILPQMETENGKSSWFGFPINVRWDAPFTASDLRKHFEFRGIETRAMICGNIARQPAMQHFPHRVHGTLKNADHIMKNAFSIGCHQNMGPDDCKYIGDVLDEFMRAY